MPGAKEYVSIGYKQHKQKRLLLCNVTELCVIFWEKFHNSKVGFSKFCALRPKWCKMIGSSGSHFVCVCAIHQNIILVCYALIWITKISLTKWFALIQISCVWFVVVQISQERITLLNIFMKLFQIIQRMK